MKVTDEVYLLESTGWNHAYLILGKENILIDTGRPGQGKGILKELKSLNMDPEEIEHILITHHDVDHVGNLALLEKETKANIWASKKDIPYIYHEKKRDGHKKYISYLIRTKKPENLRSFPENQKINGIGIIPTPGHTPGHVCFLYKDVLFVGDLLRTSKGTLEHMRTSMNWDSSMVKDSIKKITEYDFKWICPAHGYPVERDNQLEQLID